MLRPIQGTSAKVEASRVLTIDRESSFMRIASSTGTPTLVIDIKSLASADFYLGDLLEIWFDGCEEGKGDAMRVLYYRRLSFPEWEMLRRSLLMRDKWLGIEPYER